MKICHVNLASGFSGGERQTLQLIKQQVKEGFDLVVVANPKSPFAEEIKQLPCKLVLATHFTKQHSKAITQGCTAIHVHEGRAIYWALLQNLLHKIPYIVTRRIDNPLKKKWLSNLAYNKASALVGLSNEIVSKIKQRHAHSTPYKIPSSPVCYPVDEKQVKAIRQDYDGKFLVIQAANMLKHKGFNLTVDAARTLEASQPNIHFILVGDGEEKTRLEQQASGLKNITFTGKQSNMGDWFSAADLLVHSSYSEGLGSVILEAIGAGLPVIGSNAGGIPDIIDHEVSGLLFESGNAHELANAIARVVEDDDLRQKLTAGGQEKLKAFDITHTSKLYLDIYRSLQGE